jgi:hypothetical protein
MNQLTAARHIDINLGNCDRQEVHVQLGLSSGAIMLCYTHQTGCSSRHLLCTAYTTFTIALGFCIWHPSVPCLRLAQQRTGAGTIMASNAMDCFTCTLIQLAAGKLSEERKPVVSSASWCLKLEPRILPLCTISLAAWDLLQLPAAVPRPPWPTCCLLTLPWGTLTGLLSLPPANPPPYVDRDWTARSARY